MSTSLMKADLKISPPLDPQFLPAAVWKRRYAEKLARATGVRECELELRRPDGSGFVEPLRLLPDDPENCALNEKHLERTVKLLLWQKGASSVTVTGEPGTEVEHLASAYSSTGERRFDHRFFGEKVYGGGFRVTSQKRKSTARFSGNTVQLGGNWNGCRIGFDLGGSDRKVAAVKDGEVLFSEEVRWDPYHQKDIRYHFDGIQDSLTRAAKHLPRVDAIGGSSAGVFVNNEARLGSLFRGIPGQRFEKDVRPLFRRIAEEWGDVPFVVVNDGDVSAIAGAQSLKATGVLGISLGTSMAGGFVTPEGGITSWLNELAFVPVDYRDDAPVDEWSGDIGCGVQYFSQQAVARLIPASGLDISASLPFPDQLIAVQERMRAGDERAAKIYETIGAYLGYSIAHYADYYDLAHVLLLGRVTSGRGGEIVAEWAGKVLAAEFPALAEAIRVRLPDEKLKRVGQAVVAASLPVL